MRFVIFFVLALVLGCQGQQNVDKIENNTEVGKMKLMSDDFKQGDTIPKKFTCQGEDINPQLSWEDVPAGTMSFALVIDDPDAASGNFIHWMVKDIPADVREIPQDSIPGVQLKNSFGRENYGGPCPPALHRYFFKLFALDVEKLTAEDKTELYQQVNLHTIAQAELMGKYQKI